jgi:cobalt-zinc-cadmium efflux system protein
MAHDHSHDHVHGEARSIGIAFFINLCFTVLEIVGGLWTNSMAILADAVHDLGDSFALGTAFFLERLSLRSGDERYSYGYRRFSLLGALISTTVLVGGSLFVLTEAIPRLLNPEPTNAQGMVLFAIVGVLVNGAAVIRLRPHKGMNARVVAWHLLEDVLGWLAILVVSIVLLFKDIPVLDPALSILITVYVLVNVLRGLRKTMTIFLQATPEDVNLEEIEDALQNVDGVQGIHHTHVWSLDGVRHVLTTHAVVRSETTRHDVVRIKSEFREKLDAFGISHATIEFEYPDELCGHADEACRMPPASLHSGH